jgi:hypothetical protein
MSYDADADNYFSRVAAASTDLSTPDKDVINQWFVDTKAGGIWSKINEAYLFVGSTWPGPMQKLKHAGTATITNFNFVGTTDYNRNGPDGGLRGDGSIKRLMTGYSASSLSLTNIGFSARGTLLADLAGGERLLLGAGSGGLAIRTRNSGGTIVNEGSINGTVAAPNPITTGHLIVTGSSSSRQIYQNDVKVATLGSMAFGSVTTEVALFSNWSGSFASAHSNARLQFAHIGTLLSDAEVSSLEFFTRTMLNHFLSATNDGKKKKQAAAYYFTSRYQ